MLAVRPVEVLSDGSCIKEPGNCNRSSVSKQKPGCFYEFGVRYVGVLIVNKSPTIWGSY